MLKGDPLSEQLHAVSVDTAENDPVWAEACRREAAICNLLQCYPSQMTKRAVEDVAWELGLSRTTLYLLIGRYRAAGTVEDLLDQPAWQPKGRLHEKPGATFRMGSDRDYPEEAPTHRVTIMHSFLGHST